MVVPAIRGSWHRRLGRVLQARPRPQALPTSRRLDPATHLVASVPALAQSRLETAACDQALRRVRACAVDRFNSFSCIPASLSLRESCMHETCTCSLGGGRRPARKRASSDPTIRLVHGKDSLKSESCRTSDSCKRSLWVARKSVFLTVPSLVLRIPATVLSCKP